MPLFAIEYRYISPISRYFTTTTTTTITTTTTTTTTTITTTTLTTSTITITTSIYYCYYTLLLIFYLHRLLYIQQQYQYYYSNILLYTYIQLDIYNTSTVHVLHVALYSPHDSVFCLHSSSRAMMFVINATLIVIITVSTAATAATIVPDSTSTLTYSYSTTSIVKEYFINLIVIFND